MTDREPPTERQRRRLRRLRETGLFEGHELKHVRDALEGDRTRAAWAKRVEWMAERAVNRRGGCWGCGGRLGRTAEDGLCESCLWLERHEAEGETVGGRVRGSGVTGGEA